ncbi:AbrB/MazE/SpoVT family DNA-binding domain-containing protein [Tardisphaera miroshnichenkoae]
MRQEVKLDEKGRVIIPRRIRDTIGIKPGENLRVSVEDGKIVLTKSMSPEEFLKKKGFIKEGSSLPLADPLTLKKIWEAS